MNISTFTDALDILPAIDAIAEAWDGGWPRDAADCAAAENPGTLVVERSGWQHCSHGRWAGVVECARLFDHITVECSNGDVVLSATFTDATADEVVTILVGRRRALQA